MSRTATIWTIVVIVILIIIGVWIYQSNGSNPASTSATSGAPMIPYTGSPAATTSTSVTTPPVNQGTVVLNVASSTKNGTYLIAATNSMTLYTYSKDAANVSNCTGGCASAWPPYTVTASEVMPFLGGSGVNGALATITRADGSTQLTYNGMPLYFWQGDKNVGDVTGNGTNGFSVAKD